MSSSSRLADAARLEAGTSAGTDARSRAGKALAWHATPSAYGMLWSREGAPPARGGREEPPVVLVHGLVISSRYMVPLAERLATSHPTLAPDMPGFGRSDGPREALDVPALAGSLASWLQARAIGPAVLVGNSLGCQVVMELAARNPSLVRALVLAGPTFDPARRGTPTLIARLALDAIRERPSLMVAQAVDLARAGIGRGWRTYRHALDHPLEQLLPSLDMPALVVRGARDPLVSHRWSATIARGLARGSLAEIDGAPHAVNYSAPEPFARLIRDFIARLHPG